MSDRYLSFVNSPVGSAVAARAGLPRPAVLRRYRPGDPLLPGPAVLGAIGTEETETLAKLLTAAGVDVLDAVPDTGSIAALVLDARSATSPADLARVREFLAPGLRQLAGSGRVVILARPADSADVTVDTTRQALEGIVRSLAKELRRGATANLLWIEDDASPESALRFLLSGKAAYVDGQPIRLGGGPAPEPADWDRPLAGKTALVTGAARGIGAAIAGVVARDGALARVANDIGGTSLHLDVAAPGAARRLLDYLAAYTNGLDVLVHNAGVTRDKLMANMKPDQWDVVIAVNLESQLRINEALLASDQLRDQARVVCLSSTTGLAGNRGQTNYAASKAGVIGMVRSAAPAFAAHGDSTINAVAPGFIDTEMTAKMPITTREAARRLSSLQQAGLPVDVAEAVAWLCSPGAGGVNGQVLRVCGQNLVGA
jgi:3-oxoacyl-[acyl-carrier protein] reductase